MNSTYSRCEFPEDVQISRVPRVREIMILELNLQRLRKTMEELNANCDNLVTPPPSSNSLSPSGEPFTPFHDDEIMTDVAVSEDSIDAHSSISSNDTMYYYTPDTSPILTSFHMNDDDDDPCPTVLSPSHPTRSTTPRSNSTLSLRMLMIFWKNALDMMDGNSSPTSSTSSYFETTSCVITPVLGVG
ncbi:hypothetical protein ARMGADRAFT_1014638 [Armillaria gallica]|uniref:Uncharacterized protein n=1 Tax=Armillaria gallica TaxID=47427 RepID=A0A2H3DGJ0_ARMGA|nr:hypothetical protein ARMGADRAFT_1014638 [Armillaria gallica]